jgi:hypothetical protein
LEKRTKKLLSLWLYKYIAIRIHTADAVRQDERCRVHFGDNGRPSDNIARTQPIARIQNRRPGTAADPDFMVAQLGGARVAVAAGDFAGGEFERAAQRHGAQIYQLVLGVHIEREQATVLRIEGGCQ